MSHRFFPVSKWTTNPWRGIKARNSCENSQENGKQKFNQTRQEATAEEVPGSIVIYMKEKINAFKRQKQPQKFNFSNNINVTDCSVLGILKWKTFRNSPLKLPKPLAKLREKLDMFLLKKIAPEN